MTAESSEKTPSDEAVRWSRWSAMFSRVTPLVERQSWYAQLDAHAKAYTKEAVSSAALILRRDDDPQREKHALARCLSFAYRYMPKSQADLWAERLLPLAKEAASRD